MKVYIEGVRVKHDDVVMLCADEEQAQKKIAYLLDRYPLVEDDFEIIKVVFSWQNFLLFTLKAVFNQGEQYGKSTKRTN